MFPEGAPRERRSRLASVRRSAARAPRAAALLRPGPYRAGWLVVLDPGVRAARRRAHRAGAAAQLAAADVRRRAGAGGHERARGALRRPLARAARGIARRPTGSPSGCAPPGADVSMQHFRAPDANGRTVPMVNVLGVVSGPRALARRARLHRGARRPAAGPGRERQRLRHGRARRARAHARRAASPRPRSCSPRSTARRPSRPARASSPAIRRAACGCSAGIALRAVGRPAAPLVLRLSGEGHRLPAAGWLRTVEQALRDEGVQDVRLPSLGQQVAALVAPVAHGDQAALVGAGAAVVGIDGSRPGQSSAADTSQPLLGDLSRSRPTCSGASAPRRSSPRWPSTPGRGRRASARPTSSRAIACCADGRSSSSSSRC